MKKVFLFVTLLIGSVSFGQTISINGSLHSTNGENTFPIWVEEGTTIQPNSPIKSISIKEFNVIPNSNGNDLVFNKTILVYSDSVSTVPEGKTWKLESIQNGLQIGDEYAGGIICYLNGNGGGKVFANPSYHIVETYDYVNDYCNDLIINGFDDWYLPNKSDFYLLVGFYSKYKSHFSTDWHHLGDSGNEYMNVSGNTFTDYGNPRRFCVPMRQF